MRRIILASLAVAASVTAVDVRALAAQRTTLPAVQWSAPMVAPPAVTSGFLSFYLISAYPGQKWNGGVIGRISADKPWTMYYVAIAGWPYNMAVNASTPVHLAADVTVRMLHHSSDDVDVLVESPVGNLPATIAVVPSGGAPGTFAVAGSPNVTAAYFAALDSIVSTTPSLRDLGARATADTKSAPQGDMRIGQVSPGAVLQLDRGVSLTSNGTKLLLHSGGELVRFWPAKSSWVALTNGQRVSVVENVGTRRKSHDVR
jgi:hypothetical protein